MSSTTRKHMIRVPMTDDESAAVRQKADAMGIPIARLIRRCVFGVEYEVARQINPSETIKPTVAIAGYEIKFSTER